MAGRIIIGALMSFALIAPASAIDCPDGASAEALIPFNWQYTPANYVMVSVRNTFLKEVRMVEAEVYFMDGLGRVVGGTPLPADPDLAIFAGQANSFQVPAPPGYDRLSMAEVSDFDLTMCTRAVLFKDGTKIEF